MSRVIVDNYRNDPGILLRSWATTENQRSCWISVGTLVILRVGDIWRNQQLELRPDYELETFEAVQVGPATTQIVKAGHSQFDGGFLLPLGNHPWHRSNTHSFCVVVALADGRQLVIPCCELIRFYFGSSSGLLSRLFLPPLDRRALYTRAEFDKPSGRLFLELAQYISGASAADIGRLHLDPVAWRAALQIGSSILKSSVAGQRVYPQTFFPFVGKTTLVASGKWLPVGDRPDATFIVYNLRSCSHAFPFRALRYDTKGDHRNTRQGGQSRTGQEDVRQRRAAKDLSRQKLVERDASNNLESRVKPYRLEPRFPDLLKKTVFKRQSALPERDAQPVHLVGGSAVAEAAVGEPGSEQRIRPVDLAAITTPEAVKHLPAPAFLAAAVDELMQLQGIDVELLTRSGEDGWTVPIAIFANEDGEIDAGLFVEDGSAETHLRRIAVFALRRDAEHVSAVFIEAAPVHVKLYATTGKGPDEMWRTIGNAAADFIHRRESLGAVFAKEIRWIFDITEG
jgi:hypothetical protein